MDAHQKKPKGGQITLLIESTAKTDFLDWVISDDMSKDGAIVFTKRENIGSLKKLAFKDAYCLEYEEIFDAGKQRTIKNTSDTFCKRTFNEWHHV